MKQSLVVTLEELKKALAFLESWQVVKDEVQQNGEKYTLIHIVRLDGEENLIFKVIH